MTRSVDALSRAYARRAALDELDEQGVRTRQMVADYRAALPPIPWRSVVVLSALAGLVVMRALIGVGANGVAYLLKVPGLEGQQQEALGRFVDGLVTFSTTFSSAGVVDQVVAAGDVGLSGALVLAMVVLMAAYVVLRPLSSVFRVKRMLFNLSDDPDLTRTCSTWHVPRAVGLYARERSVFREAGSPVPREPLLDLALSMLGTFLTCGLLLRLYAFDPDTDMLLVLRDGTTPTEYVILATVTLLVGVRAAWLVRASRSRRAGTAPDVVVLAASARLVDPRTPLEVFGVLTGATCLLVGWWVAPLTFYRLWAQVADARCEVGDKGLAARNHPYRSFARAALAAAFALAAPLFAAVLGWRAVLRSADRTRGAVGAAAAATCGVVAWSAALPSFFLPPDDEAFAVSLLVVGVTVGLAGAVTQRVANDLTAHDGRPWQRGSFPEDVTTEFCVPPSWPPLPAGWHQPVPGFRPDPDWADPPQGWRFWRAVVCEPGRAEAQTSVP